MGAITAAMGIPIGMSGSTRGSRLTGAAPHPLSFEESLGIGIVCGLIVFLSYTFNTWPHFQDIWGRPPKGER